MMTAGTQASKFGPIPPVRYSVADDYPYQSSFKIEGKPLQVVSSLPIKDGHAKELDRLLQNLPADLKGLFGNTAESFSIALLTRAEIRPIAGESVYGLYDPPTKILYLPVDDLESGHRVQNADTIRHELIHATMDTAMPDPPSVRGYHAFWRLFRKTSIVYQEIFSEETSWLPSVFTYLIPSALAGFYAIKRWVPAPHRVRFGIAGIAISLIGAAFVYFQYRRSHMEGRGIIRDEYKKFKKTVHGQQNIMNRTVSVRANEKLGEFSTETMLAYLQSKYETSDNKNREELARKHPRLFLAYAAFFDPLSPVRFSPQIFDHEERIDGMLARHRKRDGSCDIEAAKEDLFNSYPAP